METSNKKSGMEISTNIKYFRDGLYLRVNVHCFLFVCYSYSISF